MWPRCSRRSGGRVTRRRPIRFSSAEGRPPCSNRTKLRRFSTPAGSHRSEEHTSELQSQSNLVCRLLLEKKKHTQPGFCLLHPTAESCRWPERSCPGLG